MIFSAKKFKKEVQALPKLIPAADALTSQDQARIKQNILLAIARQDVTETPVGFWTRRRQLILRYTVSAAAVFSLVAGTAFASSNAIPGDLLYPVKITTEKVQLSLASSDQSKAVLEAQFARQRIVELQKLAAQTPVPTAIMPNASGNPVGLISSSTPPALTIQTPLETQARIQANMEVNDALTALKSVQAKLQSRGDNKDAQIIAGSILNLQNQAGAQHLLGGSNNNQNNYKDHGQNQYKPTRSPAATTTRPSQLRKLNDLPGLRPD